MDSSKAEERLTCPLVGAWAYIGFVCLPRPCSGKSATFRLDEALFLHQAE